MNVTAPIIAAKSINVATTLLKRLGYISVAPNVGKEERCVHRSLLCIACDAFDCRLHILCQASPRKTNCQ